MGTEPDNIGNEMMPLTRLETYLAKIAGEDITTPEVRTRLEAYLAKIAEEDVEVPEPRTRIEYYLNKIAENGGGDEATYTWASVEITNNTDEEIEFYLPCAVPSLRGLVGYGVLGERLSQEYLVPLCKVSEDVEPVTLLKFPSSISPELYTVTVTGNIVYQGELNICNITGDGTITLASSK